tara:strand:+ start:86 stop:259 length:174 start_codon:yes stop_codon:yes gene_type:complete
VEKINILPLVDHGVDIVGDEWEDEEEGDPEMEKRFDPDHPYCTNWPVNKKKEKHGNI